MNQQGTSGHEGGHNLRSAVDDLLGVPLLPEGAPVHEFDLNRTDTRLLAAHVVLRGIGEVRREDRKSATSAGMLPEQPGKDAPQEAHEAYRRQVAAWNSQWVINDSRRQRVRDIAGPHIEVVAHHVRLLNNVVANTAAPAEQPAGADAPDSPRAQYQAKVFSRWRTHLEQPERQLHMVTARSRDLPLETQLGKPLVIVGPTGVGKTVMQAEQIRTIAAERTLVLVSGQESIKSYRGIRGKDTFRRFLGSELGGSVRAFWEGQKETDGRVQLISQDLAHKALGPGGPFRLSDFGLVIVDEGHRALARNMAKVVGSIGTRLFFYTATPYNRLDDLQKYYPCYEELTLRAAVESGLLNPAQLLSFRAPNERHALEKMAARLALFYLKEGLTTTVYCQPGDEVAQARLVAGMINGAIAQGHVTPHADLKWQGGDAVGVVSSYDLSSSNFIDEFDQGKKLGLVTTGSLEESWDPERLDTAILVGLDYSERRVRQRAGRALRLGENITRLCEVIPYHIPPGKRAYSLFDIFDLPEMSPGILIAPPWHRAHAPSIPDSISEPSGFGGRSQNSRPSRGADSLIEHLPADLYDALIEPRAVREVMIAPEDLARIPPETSISLPSLAAAYDVPERWLEIILNRVDPPIPCGVYWPVKESVPVLTRYYDTEAVQQYLGEHQLGNMLLNARELAVLAGMSEGYLFKHIIKPRGIEQRTVTHEGGMEETGFDIVASMAIMEAVDAIPVADGNDEPLPDLGRELDKPFVNDYVIRPRNQVAVYLRRRDPERTVGRRLRVIVEMVSKAHADQIRNAYTNPDIATDQHKSIVTIAKEAGVSYMAARDYIDALPEDERPEQFWLLSKATGRGRRSGAHFLTEEADKIIEAIRIAPIPAHMVNFSLAKAYFGKSAATILYRVKKVVASPEEYGLRPEEISTVTGRFGKQANSRIFSWSIMRGIERGSETLPGMQPVGNVELNYNMLARPTDDTPAANAALEAQRQARLSYTARIREQLVPKGKANAQQSQEQGAGQSTSQAQVAAPAESAAAAETRHEPQESTTVNASAMSAAGIGLASTAAQPSSAQSGDGVTAVTFSDSEITGASEDDAATPVDAAATKVWEDSETVRARLQCSPYAFQILVQLAQIDEANIRRDDSGAATGFSREGSEDMRAYSIGPPRSGWERLAEVARRGGNSSQDAAYEELIRYQRERNSLLTANEINVGRIGIQVELYIERSIARIIQGRLKEIAQKARDTRR